MPIYRSFPTVPHTSLCSTKSTADASSNRPNRAAGCAQRRTSRTQMCVGWVVRVYLTPYFFAANTPLAFQLATQLSSTILRTCTSESALYHPTIFPGMPQLPLGSSLYQSPCTHRCNQLDFDHKPLGQSEASGIIGRHLDIIAFQFQSQTVHFPYICTSLASNYANTICQVRLQIATPPLRPGRLRPTSRSMRSLGSCSRASAPFWPFIRCRSLSACFMLISGPQSRTTPRTASNSPLSASTCIWFQVFGSGPSQL